ncbi:ATP-binding cassette domain-containing protein [[Mycobacterium] burgundiense]|uniref:ATP-binding cassette domain-containing protein n=1 Tax=[Mycobacterium] burgundiense TaxID=3064286 RepID=A0ABM9LXK4_9MYCO|nr:ATP-binding cassette domain-containing protein [Mycolicibacterium sp. MU0053]CAJ1506447.1 ATP-binding cassette domain-containing protein [Mycolicibacterium sp. MU0053]
MSVAVLHADRVSVSFPGQPVLRDVTVRVGTGDTLGVRGPSGCGKTTLLRVLAGLHAPDAGTVRYSGSPAPEPGALAMLAQHPRQVCNPRWTLEQIVTEPARIRGGATVGTAEAVDRVGLPTALLDRYPAQVSDGQLQRACLARVLLQQPRYLLCDEPTAMLDPIAAEDITELLGRLSEQAAVVVVSHTRTLIGALADTVLELTPEPAQLS